MVAVVNSEGEVKANTAPFNVDIEGGTTQDLNFVAKFMRAPSAGTYSFCFITPAGKVLSEPMQVELTAVTGSTSIALEDLRMTSGDGGATPTVPSNDVSVAGTLRCKSGYFNNTLTAYIFPERGGSSLGTIGAETFFLHADHTAEFSMHGSFGNGIIGTTYMIGFFNGQVQVPGSLYFKLGEPSSVQAIDTPAEVAIMVSGTTLSVTGTESASIDVFSADGAHIFRVNGVKADISSLQPGAYIAIARTPAGPVMMKFIR